jgi:hypothetical protein
VIRPVSKGQALSWQDVDMPASRALTIRREMEAMFA